MEMVKDALTAAIRSNLPDLALEDRDLLNFLTMLNMTESQ